MNGNGDGNPETENVPATLAAVTVILVPTAVRVPVWDELLVPSGTEPKLKVLGAIERPAPVPDRAAGENVLDALLENDRLPDELPAATGTKSIEKVAFLPDVIVNGKVIPLRMKPAPVKVSVLTLTSPFVAVSVPVCGELLVPRLIVPKLKLDGERESCPASREKLTPVLLEPEITACWLAGEKTYPVLLGVTV